MAKLKTKIKVKAKPKAKKKAKVKREKGSQLTLKERKFIKFYLETGNVSKSALRAGYAFRQSGFQNLSKLVIQEAFQMLLDKQGLTDARLNEVLIEGLESNKIIGYLHQYKKKGKSGKVEKISPDEIVSSEFMEVPDMPTRHKYLKSAYKLKGKLKDKIELTGEGGEGGITIVYKIAKPPKKKAKGKKK